MTTGIVLFAHGSRDSQWRLPIESVAQLIAKRSPTALVRCAYLELCSPSLPEAASDLISAGVDKIRVFPLFLGVGKHAREDLPLLIEEIHAAHPTVVIELMPTAGESPELISLMADMALADLIRA